jgi:plastocyanin
MFTAPHLGLGHRHPPGATGAIRLARAAMCPVAIALSVGAARAVPQAITIVLDGQPVSNAVVSVYVKGGKAQAAPTTQANMGQRDKAFTPKVLVVQTGTSVNFPNFDTVRHHVYSFSPTHPLEIKLYAGTPAAPITFDKPGIVTLGCNIHDRMLGYIDVVDTPYFGLSDERGQLSVDLPAGDHRVRVWTPAMGEASAGQDQAIKVGNGPISLSIKRP